MGGEGVEAGEDCMDACLSLESLIDYHGDFIERREKWSQPVAPEDEEAPPVRRLPSKGYMDRYINPPSFLLEQKARQVEKAQKKKHVPDEPRRDVLQFLLEHAPLENWERDVLAIVREEAYYFAPPGMPKVLNEGWAAFWHSTLMTQRAMNDSEVVDFADHHAGTLAISPARLNSYNISTELSRHT